MLNKSFKKYLANPIIGIFPLLGYLLLRVILHNEVYALTIALALSVLGDVCARKFIKNSLCSISFIISALTFLFTLIVWLFTYSWASSDHLYIVVCEIIFIYMFFLARAMRPLIMTSFFRKKDPLVRSLLNEFYRTIRFIQFLFISHLFLILLCVFISKDFVLTEIADIILFSVIPVLIVVILVIMEIFKIKAYHAKMSKEEWLPIVTEKGEVTGKIAKSISMNMKNKFLHPVIRVALCVDGKVYLQQRDKNDRLDSLKLDIPFEKYLLFNHEINLAARNSIASMLDMDVDIELKFLVKYLFENEETKRLIFLFVARINDEDLIRKTYKMQGKFWTVKQIDEVFSDEVFGENFELEYEYLKNMVLIPDMEKCCKGYMPS